MLVALAVAALGAFLISNALAVHDEDFQLDGDVLASTTTNNGSPAHVQHFDWDSFFDASGNSIYTTFPDPAVPGFTASGFERDFQTAANGNYDTSDVTTYTQGSKDIDNVSQWVCTKANNVTDKGDIQNSYAVAYTDPVSGHQFLYFGLERNSNNGDANVAFWFLQSATADCSAANGTTNWTGDHQDGDLFVVSAFTKGGNVSTINAYRWNGGAGGSLGTTPVASGGDCTSTNPPAPSGDPACATANKQSISNIPWLTNNNGKTNGLGHTLLTGEFFEGGVDLTQSGLGDKCFNTFVGDTRSSQSFTATLYDFARGQLGECKSHVVTTPTPAAGSSTIPANAQVSSSDSALLTVDGVSKFSGTVKFSLCGPLAAGTTNCQTGGVDISTTTLTDVTSPQTVVSDAVTLTKVGKYCWRAVYSGDTTRGVPGSTDPKNATDQSECFTITPRTPTLTTCSGTYGGDPLACTTDGTVDFGSAVRDSANLTGTANRPGTGGLGDGSINPTGGNGPAQGTITFKLYGPDTAGSTTHCNDLAAGFATQFPNGIQKSVNGDGVYGPSGVSFIPQAPGVYHWKASYSGDLPNTNSTDTNSDCSDSNENVTVRQIPTEIKTKQSWIPNDTATVTSTSGNLVSGGNVRFRLYANDTCSGTALYDETVSVAGGAPSKEVSTSNTGTGLTGLTITTGYTDAAGTLAGPYSWKIVYTPAAADTAHLGIQSACDAEHFGITYTNDPGPGSALP